jgi:hypothetical protein
LRRARRGALLALVLATACGGARQAPTLSPTAPVRAPRPQGPALAGFRLGSSFGLAGLRCLDTRHRWETSAHGGACSGAPHDDVGYPIESVYVHNCAGRICAIVVTLGAVEGEHQLQDVLSDLATRLSEHYASTGPMANEHTGDLACRDAIAMEDYQCLLTGHARFMVTQPIPDPGDVAVLMATGASAREAATVSISLVTAEARAEITARHDL